MTESTLDFEDVPVLKSANKHELFYSGLIVALFVAV